jgi:hypothetical protein
MFSTLDVVPHPAYLGDVCAVVDAYKGGPAPLILSTIKLLVDLFLLQFSISLGHSFNA